MFDEIVMRIALLDIDNPNTTENFKPKNASEIWQFALNS